jgi:hypothetical protein
MQERQRRFSRSSSLVVMVVMRHCIILQAKASATGARKVGKTRPAMGLNYSGTPHLLLAEFAWAFICIN